MKITRRQLRKLIMESSYLIGREFDNIIIELERIVHEIGDREVRDPYELPVMYQYGNMSALRPYMSYDDGDANLLRLYVDLPNWLQGTELTWVEMERYDKSALKEKILMAFPGSFFEGDVAVIDARNWRNIEPRDGHPDVGYLSDRSSDWLDRFRFKARK